MTKLKLLLISLVVSSTAFAQAPEVPNSSDQTKVIFYNVPAQIIVAKNLVSDTNHVINIKVDGIPPKIKKVILDIESVTSKTTDNIISPKPAKYYTFGPDYPKEYQIGLNFLKDKDTLSTEVVRLTLTDADTNLPYDTLTIVYQKGTGTKPVVESTLAKSVKEIKNDINELKRQILEGDTSSTYLGKFIIKDKIISVSSIANSPNINNSERRKKSIMLPERKSGYLNVEKFYSYTDFRINQPKITRGFIKRDSIVMQKKIELDRIEEKLRKNQDKIKKDSILALKKIQLDIMGNPHRMTEIKTKIHHNSTVSYADLYYSQKKLKEVRIKVSDGFIEYIRAITTDSVSFVYNKPISIIRFDKHLDTKILNHNEDQFVFLGDLLELDTYHYFNSFADDNIYTLENLPGKKEAKLKASSGLASLIDIRLYTDLLGTFGEQPNGLVQIEATSKLPLNARNVGHTYWASFIQPFFKLSKLDSKFDTVSLISTAGEVKVNKMELFQRSFLNVGLKGNVYKVNWRPNNGLQFNVGYNFSSGNVSIGKDTVTKGIIHMPYGELAFSSKKLQNFGFDAEVRYGWQKLNKNKYFKGSGWDNIMSISTSIFFFPTQRSQDKFFVRFANYLNFQERTDDFYQLQFGYSLNLRLNKSIAK